MGRRHPAKFATHSLRRTKAVLIYRRTGNLRAVQLLLCHSKIESTGRYLSIEVVDAIGIAENIDIRPPLSINERTWVGECTGAADYCQRMAAIGTNQSRSTFVECPELGGPVGS